jgi:hypothetical protein
VKNSEHRERHTDLRQRKGENSPSDVFMVINSRRLRWTGRVTCIGKRRNKYKILVENSEETILAISFLLVTYCLQVELGMMKILK